MAIDSRTGRILWDYMALNRDSDPANNIASGKYTVTISVSDPRGYTATQSFDINLQVSAP